MCECTTAFCATIPNSHNFRDCFMLQLYKIMIRSSYCIHMTKYTPAQPREFPHVWFMCQIRCITHAPLAPDYTILQFSIQNFQFTYCTRMKFLTRKKISLRLKTRMNSFQNDLYGNKMSFWYHVNKYREDGMNLFQNKSHFSIM